MPSHRTSLRHLILCGLLWPGLSNCGWPAEPAGFRIAPFSADVTIPLNHRCMGLLPTKSREVADPLEACGFVLLGDAAPVVYVAVDWCEIRNGAYDQWREALAKASGTTRERVLVSALHQHDAPVVDAGAAALLREAGLPGELYDEAFHAVALQRVADALTASLKTPVPVTHVGTGAAVVERVASNRRVVRDDGRVGFDRGSRSGADPFFSTAPDGEIDPLVKTVSFWNGDTPVVALSVYATHPMSRYGEGVVSADFVGLARRRRQAVMPGTLQIYASGCSGDVTAGKYNDGSDAHREGLITRLAAGMAAAWEATERTPLTKVDLRSAPLMLGYYDHPDLSAEKRRNVLSDSTARTEDRIYAAMCLSSRQRVAAGQPIDFPCLDVGSAQVVLFPGESFVGYQLMAQELAPNSMVLSIGYGESWPGYVPTDAAFVDRFHDKWLWVGPGSEKRIRRALEQVLRR
jgi:hypothetical protein